MNTQLVWLCLSFHSIPYLSIHKSHLISSNIHQNILQRVILVQVHGRRFSGGRAVDVVIGRPTAFACKKISSYLPVTKVTIRITKTTQQLLREKSML